MKDQLSTQEKLWDLRKEHDYTQEFVAKAVNVATATISKYENKDNKEFNLAILARLAKFYEVSLEWLAGTTEVRKGSQTDIDELMLDDVTIELLKSGRFNSRLLCEIIKHPDFVKIMTTRPCVGFDLYSNLNVFCKSHPLISKTSSIESSITSRIVSSLR